MVRFLVGFPLVMHGLAHLGGFLASWTAGRAGFADRAWLLPGDATPDSSLGKGFSPLWLVAMLGLLGAGLGVILRRPWWPALAMAGAAVSLMTILLWWRAVPLGAKLGAALDVLILIGLALFDLSL